MYIELTCRSCGHAFRVDCTKEDYSLSECPICKAHINSNDIGRIASLTDAYYASVRWCSDVSVNCLQSETVAEVGSVNSAGAVFVQDMAQLDDIYRKASPEVKKLLATMLDKLYLLVNTDAKNENMEALQNTAEKLREIFIEKVNAKHDQMSKDLGL